MRLQTISSQHQRIKWLISKAETFGADELELQAHWARYLCVLTSGFLENALREIYGGYARDCSNSTIADYVEATLSRIQNPKSRRFIEVARSFNKTWAEELSIFLENEGRKEAIDGIMSNRHLIAHGKDSDITLVRLSDYIKKIIEVIDFIENQCRP